MKFRGLLDRWGVDTDVMEGLKSPPLIRAKHQAVTVSEIPKANAMSAAVKAASAQRSMQPD